MAISAHFKKLVGEGNLIGRVDATDRFLVGVSGLRQIGLHNQVIFENGDVGLVWDIGEEECTILNISSESTDPGSRVVFADDIYTALASPHMVGRVVSVLGKPLDGKGRITELDKVPVFSDAPPVIKRTASDKQLVTGVTLVDTLFPIVLGQRMAVIGDTRTGKSTFLTQLAASHTEADIYIYVLINKSKNDADNLLLNLTKTGAISKSIIVVADIFESLAQAYLAPYVGSAIAEYFCRNGKNVVIMYDDLSNHAKIYREISLATHTNSGRDSYPGDIFYAHSSLMERAGSFAVNKKSITALAVVLTPDDDITGYLSTNLMSMTDGQLIFTRENFQKGSRPAVSTSLSVSRIGGPFRSDKARELSRVILKILAGYRRALEFSHFQSGQTGGPQSDLIFGERILEAFKQTADQSFDLLQQQLILEYILRTPLTVTIDIEMLRKVIIELGNKRMLSAAGYAKSLERLLALKGLSK
jgi:F-type H+/Na+-transporting ATPase subunit alpha